MAQFEPKKQLSINFNNGQKYEDGDGLQAGTINNLVEGVLYAQDRAGSGEGSTILTNYDGDSKEEGFTQYYIKRGAQNKNYYNLGAFDVVADEHDEYLYLRRGTGHIVLSYDNIAILAPLSGEYPASTYGLRLKDKNLHLDMEANVECVFSNKAHVTSIYNSGEIKYITVVFNKEIGSDAEAIRLLNGLDIQYKLVSNYIYTEAVIKNQPIRKLADEGEYWAYNEWEKQLNYSRIKEISSGEQKTLADDLTAGQYTFSLNDSGVTSGAQYILVVNGTNQPAKYTTDSYTFVCTQPKNKIEVYVNTVHGTSSIMLNKGDYPIPYTPYNGKIIHEKDLSKVTEIIQPKFDEIENKIAQTDSTIDNIEQRLDSLGFKSGSLSYTYEATATQNEVKRQGNYCIINFDVSFNHNITVQQEALIATLPIGFIPTQKQKAYGLIYSYKPMNVSMRETDWVEFDIYTNGEIKISEYWIITQGYSYSPFPNSGSIKILASGYEAQPITRITTTTINDNLENN